MLGCAVERLIVLVGEAIVAVGTLPAPADKLKAKLDSPQVGISKIYDDVRQILGHAVDDRKLSRDTADVLDRRLTAMFDHVRMMRNKAGHPTEAKVSRDEALSGLVLFPNFYEFVQRIIAELTEATQKGTA